MDVVRAFVASFSQDEIQALPRRIRPSVFWTPDEVSGFAFDLLKANLETPFPEGPVVSMLAFFSQATHRLSQLALTEVEARRQQRRMSGP